MKCRLTKPQSKAFVSTAKSIGVCAGFGSGKTKVALEKAMNLLFEYPGVPVAYGAPTYDLINSIWYPAVEKWCEDAGVKYEINKGKNIITFPGLGTMICRSLNNPSRLVGWECGSAILDEFDILPTDQAKEAWRKMKARCRVKYPKFKRQRDKERFGGKKRHPNQMFAVSTPEGFKAFYELFEEDPIKGSQLIRMSTYSNAHNLPEDYIEELLANYPPQLVKAYIMGHFVNLTQGAVYPNFDRGRNDTKREIQENDELHIGMDFNVDKMAATVSVFDYEKSERLVANDYGILEKKEILRPVPRTVDELYKIHDTPRMIIALKERYNVKKHPIFIYPDASGQNRNSANASQTDITLLRDAGFKVVVNDSNPFVKDRILSVNAMFENAKGEIRAKVNTRKCPKLTKCLEQQIYAPDGTPEKKKDVDHLPDSYGYFINKHFGIARPRSYSTSIPL